MQTHVTAGYHRAEGLVYERRSYRRFLVRLETLLRRSGLRSGGLAPGGPPAGLRCEASLPGDAAGNAWGPLVVGTVKTFVDAHAGEIRSLDRLAAEVHLSKFHLARLFREHAGTSLWAYVLQARIRKAEALLAEGHALSEVALRTGFYDQSHFTRVFKRMTGLTPGAYRKRRQERKDVQEDGE